MRFCVYFIREKHAQCSPDSFYYYYYYYYYHYYYHYCYCVSLCLVGSSGIFPREQVAPSNLRSLGLALQFLQFQAMLLFAKVLCCSLCLTSPPSLSIFLMSLIGPQLQLMSGLYFSLIQINVLILLTTNPTFFHPLLFSFPHPTSIFFSYLYCLTVSTFLRMLAVPSKTDFCKVPTLYDIPNFFKLHSKSFGVDLSTPIIIGYINVSLSQHFGYF